MEKIHIFMHMEIKKKKMTIIQKLKMSIQNIQKFPRNAVPSD